MKGDAEKAEEARQRRLRKRARPEEPAALRKRLAQLSKAREAIWWAKEHAAHCRRALDPDVMRADYIARRQQEIADQLRGRIDEILAPLGGDLDDWLSDQRHALDPVVRRRRAVTEDPAAAALWAHRVSRATPERLRELAEDAVDLDQPALAQLVAEEAEHRAARDRSADARGLVLQIRERLDAHADPEATDAAELLDKLEVAQHRLSGDAARARGAGLRITELEASRMTQDEYRELSRSGTLRGAVQLSPAAEKLLAEQLDAEARGEPGDEGEGPAGAGE